MRVMGALLRNAIPVLKVPGAKDSHLARVWGGAYDDKGTWFFPAYFPFLPWVAADLRKFLPNAAWDETALGFLSDAREAARAWETADAAWKSQTRPPLPVGDDFFPKDFTPYDHQRLGIARIVNWWRTFLRWDPGTGKTRTAIDAFRVLHHREQFQRALVLGPPVVLESWQREVDRCSNGKWKAVIWDGTPEAEALAKGAHVVLASYTRVRLEQEKAEIAARELAITPAQREMYKLAQLPPETLAEYQRDVTHPLALLDYDTIVADESHYLGNWMSEQTSAAIALSSKAARRLCLTGTPGDTPLKYYAQLYFLSPGLVPLPYHKFEAHHTVRSEKNKHVVVGYRFMNEINERFNSIAHTMHKSECLDLPPMTEVDLYFDMGVAQRARYNELVMEMATSEAPLLPYAKPSQLTEETTPQRAAIRLPHGAARVNKMLQVLSGFVILGADYSICDACPRMDECVAQKIRPYTKKCEVVQSAPERRVLRDIETPKLDLFKEQLQSILDSDPTNKVIVWANVTEELDDLEAAVKALKVGCVRVDGKTYARQKRIDSFQQDPACRVYIGQVSTGIGITLTAANYTIFYSLPWDPLQYQQAVDRNNRPGQTRNMTTYRLLTSNASWALDRYVAKVLTFKEGISLTLTGLIACGSCDRQQACAQEEILPFREKCKYAANVARPVADVEVIE